MLANEAREVALDKSGFQVILDQIKEASENGEIPNTILEAIVDDWSRYTIATNLIDKPEVYASAKEE